MKAFIWGFIVLIAWCGFSLTQIDNRFCKVLGTVIILSMVLFTVLVIFHSITLQFK